MQKSPKWHLIVIVCLVSGCGIFKQSDRSDKRTKDSSSSSSPSKVKPSASPEKEAEIPEYCNASIDPISKNPRGSYLKSNKVSDNFSGGNRSGCTDLEPPKDGLVCIYVPQCNNGSEVYFWGSATEKECYPLWDRCEPCPEC